MLTRRPAASPSVVRRCVCGISATAKPSLVERGDRQADAVDRDRALLDDVARQAPGRSLDARSRREALLADRAIVADAVDVAQHEVAAEPVGARSGSSRLTRAPARSSPSVVRRSVSAIDRR